MQKTTELVYKIGNTSVRLEQADAILFLQRLGPASVDLLVTSPPYFIGKEYDPSTRSRDFEEIVQRLLPELNRILKPGGSLCWQVGNHVSHDEVTPLDYLVAGVMKRCEDFKLRNRIIWTYSHGSHLRSRFSGRHETILWYTKGDNYFFDLDTVRVPQKYPGKRHYKGPKKGDFSGNPLGKNPGDYWELGAIWDIPNVKANHVEKTEHPCQFPVALARRLVVALCPKGGVVLDPFVGSGTTAVAAVLEGRNFVGSDIVENYLAIAESRLTAFVEGTLKYRSDTPIHVPTGKEPVARTPAHFKVHSGEGL